MHIKILALADAVSPVLYDHFQPDRWRSIDLVLSAGDLPPEYLDFFCTCLNVPVVYVRGNHDAVFAAERYDGMENAHGRIVTVKGVRIAGFEGCKRYNRGGCQYTEGEMERIVRRVERAARRQGAPDIILTHAPAVACHDGADLCHQGFACFRDYIERRQPALFVHGHVHAYERKPVLSELGKTVVLNAYPYQVFELTVPDARSVPAESRPWRTRLVHPRHRFSHPSTG